MPLKTGRSKKVVSKKPVKKADGGEITYKRDGNNPVHLYSKGGCVKKKR